MLDLHLTHPFQSISHAALNQFLLFSTFASVVLFALINVLDKPLREFSRSPLGIVSLEFAVTPTAAIQMLEDWGDGIRNARKIFWLDFLFLLIYSISLGLACIWATESMTRANWITAGVILAWGQAVAGLFDVLENLLMSSFLFRDLEKEKIKSGDRLLTIAIAVLAALKFSLIAIALFYILTSITLRLFEIIPSNVESISIQQLNLITLLAATTFRSNYAQHPSNHS